MSGGDAQEAKGLTLDNTDGKTGDDSPGAKLLPGAPTMDYPVLTHSKFEYEMSHSPHGLAVIINNRIFEKKAKLKERFGTDADETAMEEILTKMGFKGNIMVRRNLTVDGMKSCLLDVKAKNESHSDRDCFICVILTYGEEGYIYGTDGEKMSIDDVVAPFKGDQCLTLAGKPKIFFIQACSPLKLEAGELETDHIGVPESDDYVERRIPTEADFLLAYSVIPGYFAWRNSDKSGSWFIQAIAEVFRREWQKSDLLTMMTRVNKKVAYDFESNAKEEYIKGKKQISYVTSMLTKDVFFSKSKETNSK